MNNLTLVNMDIVKMIGTGINPTASLLYMTILSHRNNITGECCVTQEELAEELMMSDRTIRRNLNELKKYGFLDWEQKEKINHYSFPYDSIEHRQAVTYLISENPNQYSNVIKAAEAFKFIDKLKERCGCRL